ncbi:alpha-amylase [Streptacidiphilus sp. MAP12-16]|uniref:carbohydrate-binding module family 20 domain-containing protein n=1 Tax=Streptacidiphilus sp. MAP12-16 TaxID=3156300 RepID=UPI00351292DF
MRHQSEPTTAPQPGAPQPGTGRAGRGRARLRAVLASGALLTAGIVPLTLAASAGTAHAAMNSSDVIANLFMWNWKSVANECTTVLGPAGYGGVQVAPPEDSTTVSGHPWWEIYQPVDYNLNSRMGTETQFASMVSSCRAAGVKVYVDTVINHMTGQGSSSYGGVTGYSKYTYPGLYSTADFHHYPADCPESDGQIHNWNDYTEVTHCELDNLADLRTESDYVRTQIAGYLNKLIGYGVSGFRVDAAKHIGETDLAAIEGKLNTTADGTAPYVAQEVAAGGTGQLAPSAFEGTGSLLGFDYADDLKAQFTGSIANLKTFGSSWGLLPANKELTFVENHDTERDGSTLSYKSGAANTLATEFELAWGYGTPEVYAGFDFTNSDDSPPADSNGFVTGTTCGSGWECTDRITGVNHLVAWHNHTAGQSVANWYDDGSNLIAFSRGNQGWIAINNESSAQTKTFATGLAAGTYCDIVHGAVSGGSCSGPTFVVNGSGNASVTVPAMDSVAFDTSDVVSASSVVSETFSENATTVWGQNVYVVGSIPALGGWNTSNAVLLSSASYPVWTGTLSLPPNTYVEYKYIKKDASGTVTWESGSNRSTTTPASGSATLNDTWK